VAHHRDATFILVRVEDRRVIVLRAALSRAVARADDLGGAPRRSTSTPYSEKGTFALTFAISENLRCLRFAERERSGRSLAPIASENGGFQVFRTSYTLTGYVPL